MKTPNQSQPQTRHTVTVTRAQSGERLDKRLALSLPVLSRARLKVLIEAGQVTLRDAQGAWGTITEPAYRVKPGQYYTITVPAPTAARPLPQNIPLSVAFEDDYLIVIDKPAGLVVHPAPGNPDRTLVNALIAHCGDSLSGIGGERRPGIVHRLDKDTSGLMVAAKTDAAHRGLADQFAAHSLTRAYNAVVRGVPRPVAGTVEGNIGRHPQNRKKMAVVPRGGKAARTGYKTLRVFSGIASLVECRLATGRTHQIRVHMTHRGHPLVGDRLYGRSAKFAPKTVPESVRNAIADFPRQALHAVQIGFLHPISGENLAFESELPLDIQELITILDEF